MVLAPVQPKSPRPYWHVDAKWIAGILLFISLGASLLLFNLWSLTERDRAVNLSAVVVANLLSKNGLNDASGLRQFRTMVSHTKGNTIAPISEFPSVKISKHDALTLDAAQLKIALFSQITGPIYDLGLEAAAKQFTSDPARQQQFIQQASTLGVLTKSTHELLMNLMVASMIISVLLLVAVVYFSAGWGRLASPGFIFLTASPFGSVTGLILLLTSTGSGSLQSILPASTAQDIGGLLSRSYALAFVAGIVLLVTAFIGKVISMLVHQSRLANPASRA